MKPLAILLAFLPVPNIALAVCNSANTQLIEFPATVYTVDYICEFQCRYSRVRSGRCESSTGSSLTIQSGSLSVHSNRGRGYPAAYKGTLSTSVGPLSLFYIAASNNDVWGTGVIQFRLGNETQGGAFRYK